MCRCNRNSYKVQRGVKLTSQLQVEFISLQDYGNE